MKYENSINLFQYSRLKTNPVKVGNIEIGGKNFYFNIAGVLSRQGIGNTFVFYDEKLI